MSIILFQSEALAAQVFSQCSYFFLSFKLFLNALSEWGLSPCSCPSSRSKLKLLLFGARLVVGIEGSRVSLVLI